MRSLRLSERTIVVAGTNEARREINRAVRKDLGLDGWGREHTILVRRDTTQAERAFAKNYVLASTADSGAWPGFVQAA